MQLDKVRFARFVEEGIPFNAELGLRVEALEVGRVTVRMPYVDKLVGDVFRPALHGGAIAAMIDATAGAAAATLLTLSDRLSTIDLRIDYLRPAPKNDLVAIAEVRRGGTRIAVVNVVVTPVGDEASPVAEGRAVFDIRRDVGVPTPP